MMMTTRIKLLAVIMPVFVFTVMAAFALYVFDNYMFAWQARLYWGNTPFVAQSFREAAVNEKSGMVADLVSANYLVGKRAEQVKLELGPSTGGYYNSDTNLTYIVRTDGRVIWDLVFIVNPASGTVEHIWIYKRRGGLTRRLLGNVMRVIDEIF